MRRHIVETKAGSPKVRQDFGINTYPGTPPMALWEMVAAGYPSWAIKEAAIMIWQLQLD